MRWRNGEHGYGLVSKVLHWVTVVAIAAQFTVGLTMDLDSLDPRTEPVLRLHVGLGVLILCLGAARVLWRRTGLPPWAPYLGARSRRVAGLTEKVLLGLLFVIPLSGLLLVLSGDDDWLPLHLATHVLFLAALAVHLGLHLVHARHGQLRRML